MKQLNGAGAHPSGGESENLSKAEMAALRSQLKERVQIIHETLNGWKAAPGALTEIRDQRLYRAGGFSDFGHFCKEELKIGKSTVNRHIAIGEVYTFLASAGAKVLPSSERQMRPLLGLRKMDESPTVWQSKVAQVWKKAVNDYEITKKPLTEKSVSLARRQLGFDPAPKADQSTFDVEKEWSRLESRLWHERELWPLEYWHDLDLRLAGLLSGWEGQGNRLHKGNESPTEIDNVMAEPEPPISGKPLPVPTEKVPRFFVWSNVNWELHNRDLAKIWGLKPDTVRQTRNRKKVGRALDCDPAEYAKLLEAEKRKAKSSKKSSEG